MTKAITLTREAFGPVLDKGRQALIDLADELHATVDERSAELSATTDRTILITWIVIALGLAASFIIALSIVQVEVVKVVLSFRGRILDVAEGRLDLPIANLDRPNEIGEMSRALQILQVGAREREIQSWVKAEVAATTERLQSTEDFPEFATSPAVANFGIVRPAVRRVLPRRTRSDALHSRRSLRDRCLDGTARLTRSAKLWSDKLLLNVAVSRLSPAADNPLQVSAGVGTVTPACVLFVPVLNQDVVLGGHRTGTFGSGVGSSAGAARRVVTDGGAQHQDSC